MRAPLVHCTLHCPPGALCSALQHPGALCSILPLGKWCSALTLCVTVLCTAPFLGTVFMHCFSWALRSTLHSWGTVLCQLLLGTVPCTATWWYCALHCPSRALWSDLLNLGAAFCTILPGFCYALPLSSRRHVQFSLLVLINDNICSERGNASRRTEFPCAEFAFLSSRKQSRTHT